MNRSDLIELHYITAIGNVPSILVHGILSHNRARALHPRTIANPDVQRIRARIRLPTGRPLHDYANLYFTARNPMLYTLLQDRGDLCVLAIDVHILDLPGVVIADGNAARRNQTAFRPAPSGLAALDQQRIFAEYWTSPDPIIQYENKRVKCAEVLVPDRINPRFVLSARVATRANQHELSLNASSLTVIIDEHLFFTRQ